MREKHKCRANLLCSLIISAISYDARKIINEITKHSGIFLFIALSMASDIAYSSFTISLKEIPEWAPGYPLKIRHIIIDNKGIGSVVVTKENAGEPEVSQIELFEYDPDAIEHHANEYQKYKDFYGVNENSNGRIVEGNPKTVVLSFFKDGQLMKFISLRGALAYSDKSGNQFQLPKVVIALRDKLLAYAEQAEPQTKAKYYMTATPYTENQKYWLLKSTQLESILAISDISNQKHLAFLNALIKNSPAFLAVKEKLFLELKNEMKLSNSQFKGILRIPEDSDVIVEIRFMKSTGTNDF